ncbi:MAG: histidine phosphatase family protein [Alphaproteobacteria bacterium]
MSLTVTRWWWVRHAPVINPDGTIYGSTDPIADVSDTASFDGLARKLPPGAVWVTSHLTRARQTAEGIRAAGLDTGTPRVEPDLGEQNFGAWHGLSYEEVDRAMGGHRFWLAPARHRPPEGESFVELIERAVPVILRLTAEHVGRDIVCVAHGGTIRAAVAHALGLDPEIALRISTVNLGITRLDHLGEDGRADAWRVGWINLAPK